MKKRDYLLVFVLLILISNFVFALNETSDSNLDNIITSSSENLEGVDKAYSCLRDEIEDKDKLSFQEAIFVMMALGSESKATDAINLEKSSGKDCWPKSSCNVKETSQVAIAYERSGKDTDDIKDWLLRQNSSSSDLNWFIEIDVTNRQKAECTLKYGSEDRKVSVNEDMTLSGNAGSCLSISSSGYWLKVKEECFNREFSISCNQDFVTALVYQKSNGGTVYVLPETHSAPSLGTTKEKISSQCFKSGGRCDYEGTLWASLALNQLEEETNSFLPYLIAYSSDNTNVFPSTFLYILTGGDDYYSQVVQAQKNNKYWEFVGAPYNRFYYTALALLSIGSTNSVEVENAKNYLLSVQTDKGCWNNNNIKDTAFLLYSGWRKGASSSDSSGGSTASCESSGYFCEIGSECTSSGGNILYNYDCSANGGFTFCCSVNIQQQTCDQKGGIVCSANQECTGRLESSVDGSCCIQGACQTIQVVNLCEQFGGTCRTSCEDGEEESSDSCPATSDLCCKVSEDKGGYGLIILLVILILIILLAIIFRHKLRVWWYRFRGGIKSSEVRPSGGSSPSRTIPQQFRKPFSQGFLGSSPNTRKPVRDKDIEDTLRKLRDLGK